MLHKLKKLSIGLAKNSCASNIISAGTYAKHHQSQPDSLKQIFIGKIDIVNDPFKLGFLY